jgi:hypothetical protein
VGKNTNLKRPKAEAGKHLKAPSTDATGSSNHETPVFCLKDLSNFSRCPTEDQEVLAKHLHTLCQKTWQELLLATHRHGGVSPLPIKKLKGVKIPPDLADHTDVCKSRYQARKAMIGIRVGRVFRLLHLDHNFTAYDHGD